MHQNCKNYLKISFCFYLIYSLKRQLGTYILKTLKLKFLNFKLKRYFCSKQITMAGNSYGTLFRITTFGESHGEALGGIIDGCPSGITIDLDAIQLEMSRRKPGQSAIVTQRKEPDDVQFLSGIFEGKTTGTPIGFIIPNTNQKSDDYSHIKDNYRPSHADYVYDQKYGFRDYRGGGRSSARETASRVVAGAVAKQMLPEIKINAYVSSVGPIHLDKKYHDLDFSKIESNPVRCPDEKVAAIMEEYIRDIRKQGDTVGGIVTCVIQNVPVGLGEPVFDKLHAELGKAMLSINAVKGFEFGSGFVGSEMKGSEHNDLYHPDGTTQTNLSGGIQGGISNGMDIYFRVAFKPVATIMQKQESLDNKGNITEMTGKGRHDPCVVPRAVPIVEAMAAIVLADFYLINKTYASNF
jgi:chorismate synthase